MDSVTGAPASRVRGRQILHVDMDAFFVSCELLRRPELRGRPVIVGGTGERGVVAAASYEARSYGVHSAMPSVRARRLCPDAVILRGDHRFYGEISQRVIDLFREVTPLVEPISLDEAFLDVTGAERASGRSLDIGRRLREQVLEREHLTCSVGVAPSKFVAKLASEAAKPRASREGPIAGSGVHVVLPDSVLDFLHPLPVGALWGVGPATHAKLDRLGVATIGDLARLPEDTLVRAVGNAAGRHLHQLALGIDDRPVIPDQVHKSIGHEETFARDLFDPGALDVELVRMADAVAGRLRHHRQAARTITVKVRFGDFSTITRSETAASPVDSGLGIVAASRRLLGLVDPAAGVRLLGVSASNLVDATVRQLSFDDLGRPGRRDVDQAVDEIRSRFGADAIGPGSIVRDGRVRVLRGGDQQWGPDAER